MANICWLPALALILAAAPEGAMETRGWPLRTGGLELVEFSLCELDKKTHEQLADCIPARVPGEVFTALMEADRLPDPYRDLNSKQAQWVDDRAWRYEALIPVSPPGPGRRTRLLFLGVNYQSRIELNGKLLAEHTGMFSRIDLDISEALKPGPEQKLSVTLAPPESRAYRLHPNQFTVLLDRRKHLITQMSFEWDFAPRLIGTGLWDRVYVYETGPVSIRDLFVKPSLDGRLSIEVELTGAAGRGELEFEVRGENFESEPVRKKAAFDKPAGTKLVVIELEVENPRLWWPWDMGEPNLYRASVRASVEGIESDRAAEVFGFREISWRPNPEAWPGAADWTLYVNGKREFMRGANWVPPEAMIGRMNDDRYGRLIEMAKSAGVNSLRVWGGGNRERRAFYDYCDRAGVLVWQEFPFACVYVVRYPRSEEFVRVVRQEAEEMVRQLRNHASLFMWCGGNEFNVAMNPQVLSPLKRAVAELDPTRRFLPGSPFKGDVHNWVVWHQQGNLDDYFDDISPLPSEFGLQAYPALSTLEKWLSPERLWPINRVHEHHNLQRAKMDKYVSAIGHDNTLESYVLASQLMQAHYLQRGIENWRQRKYRTSGTFFWQLNEPWPAICWSVIDYELTPKLAYHALKNTYHPLLISARYQERRWEPGETFRAELLAVNDLHREFTGLRVRAELCGARIETGRFDAPADSVTSAGMIEFTIPADCGRPELKLELESAEEGADAVRARNLYHLWIYDPKPAGSLNRSLQLLAMWGMTGSWQNQFRKERD